MVRTGLPSAYSLLKRRTVLIIGAEALTATNITECQHTAVVAYAARRDRIRAKSSLKRTRRK